MFETCFVRDPKKNRSLACLGCHPVSMGDEAGVRELGNGNRLRVREGGGSRSRILKKLWKNQKKFSSLSSNRLSKHEPVPNAVDLDQRVRRDQKEPPRPVP